MEKAFCWPMGLRVPSWALRKYIAYPPALATTGTSVSILFHQFVGAYKEEHGQGVFMLPKSLLMEGEATSDAKIDQIWDEAVEYFEFNVAGSYVGESTPTFLTILPDTEWQEGFQSRY